MINYDDECNFVLKNDFIKILNKSTNLSWKLTEEKTFKCIEFNTKLNIFTFGKISLPINFTIIASPISLCQKGYLGNLEDLIKYYKNKKGNFLILNDSKKLSFEPKRSGNTLPTCIFENKFDTFGDYINALRSSYRRKILLALKKGKNLEIKKIKNRDFDEKLYKMYLNILNKSKYKIETLNSDFFKLFDGEIFVFYNNNSPVAFVLLKEFKNILYYIFGGMDYNFRDEFDLYYNMLLFIIKQGINRKVKTIEFGQTTESVKLRIGCILKEKFLHVFSSNKLFDFLLVKFLNKLEYKYQGEFFNVFK